MFLRVVCYVGLSVRVSWRSFQAPQAAITKNFPISEVARHCIPEDCRLPCNGWRWLHAFAILECSGYCIYIHILSIICIPRTGLVALLDKVM